MNPAVVSESTRVVVQRLARRFQRSSDEVLAELFEVAPPQIETTPLATYVASVEFERAFGLDEKYLALLSWVARQRTSEFGEFVRVGSVSGRHYLGWSHPEVLERCRHNRARQIDGTQFWAVMNIEAATKRRFAQRLLEFMGYRDVVIAFVMELLDDAALTRPGAVAA